MQLARAMGNEEWSQDERFLTNPNRVAHREELDALLKPLFLSRSREDWKKRLNEEGVPADIVASIPEALDAAQKRGRIVEHPHPKNPEQSIYTLPIPYHLDGMERSAKRRPPNLGEHQEEVLKEWLSKE